VLRRVFGHGGSSRIDDDQPGAAVDRLVDLPHQDRVALGGVRSDDEDEVGPRQIGDGVGHRAAAQGLDHGDGGRGVAEPRAVVHVVGPESGADQPLEEVILLVRAFGRGEPPDRVGAVPVRGLPQLAGGQRDRLVPGDRAEGITVPQQRLRQTVGRGDKLVGGPPLDAEGPPAYGVFPVGQRSGQAAPFDLEDDAAARSAVRTGGADESNLPAASCRAAAILKRNHVFRFCAPSRRQVLGDAFAIGFSAHEGPRSKRSRRAVRIPPATHGRNPSAAATFDPPPALPHKRTAPEAAGA